ncbi:hypothetical protein FRC08_017789 [Ceratobasidium sp. 394]|nr:hypothetical protein FRC08_017789 [Ceratobasidium sp. 394]KAG9084460.1 hypothetical protein FS749_005212 [Ceratobasidium sp. UAMH 11750]
MPEPNAPTSFVLHIWPSKWDLPSLDPQCIAAVIYMQLTFPGRYSIVECSDPDQSPSGQLPFLTHETHEISPLPSIISYLDSLSRSESHSIHAFIDAGLKSSQSQRATVWKAYAASQLGDLLAHQMFVEHYWTFTHRVLSNLMPLPQRLFVPGRLRKLHQPRLEAIGMWDAHFIEEPEAPKPVVKTPETPKAPPTQFYKHAFARERLLERARTTFGLLKNLLRDDEFVYGNSPTSLDIIIASHILPLLYIPFPNPLLSTELRTSFPELSSHADRVLEYSRTAPSAPTLPAPTVRSSLTTVLNSWRRDMNVFAQEKEKGPAAEKEASLRYGRWIFGLLAGVGSVVYLVATGIVSIKYVETEEVEVTQEMLDSLDEGDDED